MFQSDLGIKYVLLSQMGFLGEYFLMRFNEDIESGGEEHLAFGRRAVTKMK